MNIFHKPGVIECPTCGAKPNNPCLQDMHEGYSVTMSTYHAARIDAAFDKLVEMIGNLNPLRGVLS